MKESRILAAECDQLSDCGKDEKLASPILKWLRSAAHPATVRRAFMTAVIVGFVLISINHGSAILSGQLTNARIFQMCLTVLVPYVVSTASSVATRNERAEHGFRDRLG
jgi:hypothetical protein